MTPGRPWKLKVGDRFTGPKGAPAYGTVQAEPRLKPATDTWSVQTELGTFAFLRIENIEITNR